MINISSIFLVCLLAITAPALTHAQAFQPQTRKFDEFTVGIGNPHYGYGDYERQEQEAKVRLALYLKELRRAGARPYAITYSPRVVLWEIYDRSIAEMRAGALWGLTSFFDWRNINVVNGGFREQAATELWIVPPGAQPPCPTPTVKSEDVAYCPRVSIDGVRYVTRPEIPISFRARVEVNSGTVKLRYHWEVSRGEIVSGQDSDTLNVSVPTASEGEVVARVRLEGFSLECPVESTVGVFRTAYGFRHFLFDEFGNIGEEDEMARLDNLAITLQNDPTLQVHIVFYGGRSSLPKESMTRAARARNYLVNTRGLDADRILTIEGGYRDSLSGEYWLSLRGASAPNTRSTVDKQFVKPKARARR